MKVVLAPDSFKESVSATHAAAAMARGVRAVLPDSCCIEIPMADGGEGTVDALTASLDGVLVSAEVAGPLGAKVRANYGWVESRRLAVIEAATAVGIGLVPRGERDILRASSQGLGQLITDALDRGARTLIIGVGGTATNDGGAGMLQALGAILADDSAEKIAPGPMGLESLAHVDLGSIDARVGSVSIIVASDVTNPLLGDRGASAVFGPQKGATQDLVPRLDAALLRLAYHLDAHSAQPVRDQPGAGAGGGLGAALLSIGAVVQSGIDVVIGASRLENALESADLCITGEGSVDAQTLHGKTPFGVAQAAKRHGVPVVVLAGRIGAGADALLDLGVDALLPINQELIPIEEALGRGAQNLEAAAASVIRLLQLGGRITVGKRG